MMEYINIVVDDSPIENRTDVEEDVGTSNLQNVLLKLKRHRFP